VRREEIEMLYRQYGAVMHRRARAILYDSEAARDVVQELFINVMKSPAVFRNEASPLTWLYQGVTNLCLRRLRDLTRQHGLREENLSKEEQHTQGSPPEDSASLASVLRRVPEALREIGIMYFVDEMSQDEIAARLKVARRTIGNRLEEFRKVARELAGEPS
jgi:RNA polymerase sigma-70 factor (ECF subfamily)